MSRNLAATASLTLLLSAALTDRAGAQVDPGDAGSAVVEDSESTPDEGERQARKDEQRRAAIVGMIAVGGIVLAGAGLLCIILILGRRARRPQLSRMTRQPPTAAAGELDESSEGHPAAVENGSDGADASARDTEVT